MKFTNLPFTSLNLNYLIHKHKTSTLKCGAINKSFTISIFVVNKKFTAERVGNHLKHSLTVS